MAIEYLTEKDGEKMREAIYALEQEPCEDAVSRQAVEKITWEEPSYIDPINALTEVREKIRALPSVTPQQKIGHWIADVDRWGDIVTTVNGYRCSECNAFDTDKDNYCPSCGLKMFEPQGRSDKEWKE